MKSTCLSGFIGVVATTLVLAASCGNGSNNGDVADDLLADGRADDTSDVLGQDTVDQDLAADEIGGEEEFTPDEIEALQTILDDYIQFSEDPGFSFAIHIGDKKWWSGVSGWADLKEKKPVTAQTQFRVGSNTKPITAAWILMLVEEGKIDLDAPVTTYLPQYPQWSKMTVRHLLGMEAGIPEYLGAPDTLLTVLSNPSIDLTPAEVVDFVKDMPMDFEPGEGCKYSNTDYTVLGMIGEAVTGNKARDELRERIFEPLGMNNTYLEMTGDPTDRLAHGYMDLAVIVPLMRLPPLIVNLFPKDLFVGDTQVVDATTLLPPSLTWTGGSLVSVPDDLAVFQMALQSGKLLKPETMAEMRKFHPCSLLGGTVQYGLGVMKSDSPIGEVFGHGGLNFGFHVETYYSPEHNTSFCHMHNFLPAQVVTVSDQVVAVAMGVGEPVAPRCEIPESVLGDVPADGTYLKMLFKGPVGDGTPDKDVPGMGSAWANLGAGWSRLYGLDRLGIYASAVRQSKEGVDTMVLSAFGPSDAGATHVRWLHFAFDASVLDSAALASLTDLDFSDATKPFPVVIDLELTPEGFAWTSECIVGIPDPALESRVFLCDGGDGAKAGAMLRTALVAGMTGDVEEIETRLGQLGIDRCKCYDEGMNPISCPAD